MRRDKLRIVVSILETCMSGANKTKIVYKTNINFKVAGVYLDMLKREEFLRSENPRSRELYITTEKGMALLNYVKSVYDMLEQYTTES